MIDYTRLTQNDIWQATNLGKMDFKGIELKTGPFSYTYTEVDKNNSGFLSKYALDILKHQLILDLNRNIRGIKIGCLLSYNERKFGETYFIGNLRVSKAFQNKYNSIEPFLKIDNFTDTDYSEVAGVIQPGRWIQGGIKINW
jgi:iron complex outermembrane receptor protein